MTDKIMQKDVNLEDPYKCDPTDNEIRCKLYYNITDYEPGSTTAQDFVETYCMCSLD